MVITPSELVSSVKFLNNFSDKIITLSKKFSLNSKFSTNFSVQIMFSMSRFSFKASDKSFLPSNKNSLYLSLFFFK